MSNTIEHGHFEPRAPQTPERRLWAVCLMDGIREAIACYLESLDLDGLPAPGHAPVITEVEVT